MLSDPACLGNLPSAAADSIFDPEYWRARGELVDATAGRGSAWFIAPAGLQESSGPQQATGLQQSGVQHACPQPWVLRHYRRGGFIARLSQDRYLWAGEDRVRAFSEWRLLEFMRQRGLPVPKPVAARYERAGPWYRCDLIMERIVEAQPLSAALALDAIPESAWRAAGDAVARLHGAGVDHADLNAHNLLLGPAGASVIDFDRGRVRAPGGWPLRNLRRLQRSLVKISRGLPPGRYTAQCWEWFMAGYGATARATAGATGGRGAA